MMQLADIYKFYYMKGMGLPFDSNDRYAPLGKKVPTINSSFLNCIENYNLYLTTQPVPPSQPQDSTI